MSLRGTAGEPTYIRLETCTDQEAQLKRSVGAESLLRLWPHVRKSHPYPWPVFFVAGGDWGRYCSPWHSTDEGAGVKCKMLHTCASTLMPPHDTQPSSSNCANPQPAEHGRQPEIHCTKSPRPEAQPDDFPAALSFLYLMAFNQLPPLFILRHFSSQL